MRRAEQAALWFFAAGTLLTLGVSLPATYAALALFHDAGGWGGWVLTLFALVVFELGAVGAKLATLAIPRWRWRLSLLTVALLLVTTAANYAHGYDLSQAAHASPTLAAVLRDPRGAVVATVAAAALFPLLLFVFLSAFVARAEQLARGRAVLARIWRIVARSRARVAATRARLADARAELAAAHRTLAETRAALADSHAQLAQAQEAERVARDRAQEEVAAARADLLETEEAFARARADRDDGRARLAQYEGWLRQAQAELERERARPLLSEETALRFLVDQGIVPESTARGWKKRQVERIEG